MTGQLPNKVVDTFGCSLLVVEGAKRNYVTKWQTIWPEILGQTSEDDPKPGNELA